MVPYDPVIFVFALALYIYAYILAAATAALFVTGGVVGLVALALLPFRGGRRFVCCRLARGGYGPARWRTLQDPGVRVS